MKSMRNSEMDTADGKRKSDEKKNTVLKPLKPEEFKKVHVFITFHPVII